MDSRRSRLSVKPLPACGPSSRPPITSVKVDVLPSQVEQLAATRSGAGRDVKERKQPVLLRDGQKHPELRDGPDSTGFLRLRPWPLGSFYRVASDELVHDDGVAERLF